ncbi:MAG TPA: zf-HC2 domain-containing protein [Actinomycetota bacterium]|nr:zf-HC2 domain-containing protein [Actinomycetota bacterium]
MTKDHLEIDSISAYLDGELPVEERSAVESHLQTCAQCSATQQALSTASGGVASLPQLSLTADEHRELRVAVLASRRARKVPWRTRYTQWAMAGGLAVVAMVAAGYGFLRDGPSGGETSSSLSEGAAPAQRSFDFRSGDQVDRTVAGLPEVAAGLNRYRPEDAPPKAMALPRTDDGTESAAGAGSAEPFNPAAPPPQRALARTDPDQPNSDAAAPQPEAASDAAQVPDFSNEAADQCLSRISSTQSYPMVGLLAREATYQGTPVWLLVFAWTPDPEVGKTLDQWQTWLVRPQDCAAYAGPELESRVLYRSFSGQT